MTAPAWDTDDTPLVTVVGREANQSHGHIALGDRSGPPIGTYVDLGDGYLRFWSYESARLDASGARELAADLLAWADRVPASSPVLSVPDTQKD